MTEMETGEANEWAQRIWDINGAFWNEQMGEGNDFVNYLIWPATERLLELKSDEEVLDIACGNGFASRKMSGRGAHFSFILERELQRNTPGSGGQGKIKIRDALCEIVVSLR